MQEIGCVMPHRRMCRASVLFTYQGIEDRVGYAGLLIHTHSTNS